MGIESSSVEDLGLNPEFWSGKRVLVTGHTGFKGAWLTLWLQLLGARVTGFALAPEHDAAAFPAMGPWDSLDSHYQDLREKDGVRALIDRCDPEVIFHLGAQALVRRAYATPIKTYEVNCLGTLNVLAAANVPSLRACVVVTSDKVYRPQASGRPYRENDPLGGVDPYSSSKACVELIVAAWRESYGKEMAWGLATARAGNVIGGGDVAEDRLIPDAFKALAGRRALMVRNPDAVRPWQFVLEPLLGYLLLAQRLSADRHGPHAYNFGPPEASCLRVSDLVELLFSVWGDGRWVADPESGPLETHELRLYSDLALSELGWCSRIDASTAIRWTVEWQQSLLSGRDMRQVSIDQIARYRDSVVA